MTERTVTKLPSSTSIQKRPLPTWPQISSFSLPLPSLPGESPTRGLNKNQNEEAEEIYISSASFIELDSHLSTTFCSSDSGIYNASTNTGFSCCSDGSERVNGVPIDQGSTYMKTIHTYESSDDGYEEQNISVWIDFGFTDEDIYEPGYGTTEDESIYEVIPADENCQVQVLNGKDTTLIRTGRNKQKVKRNVSFKKEDIFKGLSKINRISKMFIEDVYSKKVKFSSVGRRKISLSQLLSPEQEKSQTNATFYVPPVITSNQEITALEKDSASIEIENVLSKDNTLTKADLEPQSETKPPVPPSRRRSGKNRRVSQPIIRPIVPPPAPPSQLIKKGSFSSSLSSTSSDTSNYSIDSSDEKLSVTPSSLSSEDAAVEYSYRSDSTQQFIENGDKSNYNETYTSHLIQSEPLYQFYDCMRRIENIPSTNDNISDKFNDKNVIPNFEQSPYYNCDNYLSCDLNEDYVEHTSLLSEIVSDCHDLKRDAPGMIRKLSADMKSVNVNDTKVVDREQKSSVQELVVGLTAGNRTFWSELQEVVKSGLLNTISQSERQLQEAMFEIFTSEASYLKSINVLVNHFASSKKLNQILTERDHNLLFSQVFQVQSCSDKFLQDLESRWQENPSLLITGICDLILSHAKSNFQIYICYCSNQVSQDKTLKRLRSENSSFVEVLKDLESSQVCQSLSMYSFLMLPMQRITRLPLLTKAILNQLTSSSPEYDICNQALVAVESLVRQCNEAARKVERQAELVQLARNIDFRGIKPVAIVHPDRFLVKQCQVNWIVGKAGTEKLTFGRKVKKQHLELLLFNDLLIVCKKKSDDKYVVVEHSPRAMVTVDDVDSSHNIPGLPGGEGNGIYGFPLWLILLQNSEKRTQEMLISFRTETDRNKWRDLVTPSHPTIEGEQIYESWDCPQVEVMADYNADQTTELSVCLGETANVLKKTDNGWLYVERYGDGLQGWLPSSVTKELESEHRRGKNFRQRYHFLRLLSEVDSSEAA